ncbi:ATP-binding protein [Halorussus limi]|uniref:histidine kinase n=1 Tax=Halorussus limi TaxID=2938695 RepID=A0A8U0HS91_9EURY|nr:ATP-binding protein [Halorussus limi]UPV73747.1 ATP-binding protein [Halorussus limi]
MSPNSDAPRSLPSEQIPSLLVGLGGLFFLLFLAGQYVFYRAQFGLSEGLAVSFSLYVIFMAALIGGGYWLGRSDLPPKRYPRIGGWVLGGLLFFLTINLAIMASWSGGTTPFRFSWGLWAANVGASGGLLVGCVEARAIQRELEAQRASMRAEQAEGQRQWFDYLNGLLRHEVLNTTNVIIGYASVLLEDDDLDGATESALERIYRQGQDMTKVIRDVQVLIELTQDDADLRPVDLRDVLDDELRVIAENYEAVEIETAVPESLLVTADDLLPRIFGNLLRNAVEHHDGDRPRIRVTAERTGETVAVRVADDGPGVPAKERAALFERSDNSGATHGLGLYIVQTLTERYDGSVELTETGPEGSVFTVTLPAADRGEAVEEANESVGESGETVGDSTETPGESSELAEKSGETTVEG